MQELMTGLLWVAAGSAAGGAMRFLVSGLVARSVGETFPWGTMVVNVTGSLAIGALAAAADGGIVAHRPAVWLLAVTGFLGSFTTVSSFSLQTLALMREGETLRAGGNIALTLALCLAAASLGFLATRAGLS
ncbi:fluoride efflux transporter CrcB [Kaustia mangrovi]|uniref:Fluoride-specific ion channel FluC n=1 Tax=Kaustia mangrovi TaxID=2593653 RepID=A0A7S8C7L6_9HYPH|nr:fluoride efflux transporter CrcB [Kaustia mangrovi]QPC44900.1 fluoride efflux transporter CrcB [Kaustia mangrovi]